MKQIVVDRTGRLTFESLSFTCALGKGGITSDKREGDGATPAGRFALRQLLYRPDKLSAPHCLLSKQAIRPEDGWCVVIGELVVQFRFHLLERNGIHAGAARSALA